MSLKDFTKDKMAEIIQEFIMMRLGLSNIIAVDQDVIEFFLFYNKTGEDFEALKNVWISQRRLECSRRDYIHFKKGGN